MSGAPDLTLHPEDTPVSLDWWHLDKQIDSLLIPHEGRNQAGSKLKTRIGSQPERIPPLGRCLRGHCNSQSSLHHGRQPPSCPQNSLPREVPSPSRGAVPQDYASQFPTHGLTGWVSGHRDPEPGAASRTNTEKWVCVVLNKGNQFVLCM